MTKTTEVENIEVEESNQSTEAQVQAEESKEVVEAEKLESDELAEIQAWWTDIDDDHDQEHAPKKMTLMERVLYAKTQSQRRLLFTMMLVGAMIWAEAFSFLFPNSDVTMAILGHSDYQKFQRRWSRLGSQ